MVPGADFAQRVRRRVGVGIIEVEAATARQPSRSLNAIAENLANRISLLLVAVIVAAQMADVVTTIRALTSTRYFESNPLLRELLIRSPLAAYSVKLLVVTGMVLLILSRFNGRRAQVALAVAAGLSLVAPLLNFRLLMHL